MVEPGISVDVGPAGEPLVSEIAQVFDPLTLPTGEALASEEALEEAFKKEFGPNLHLIVDDPGGKFKLQPGGSFVIDGGKVPIQRLTLYRDAINVNVRGTTDAAEQIVQAAVIVLDQVGGANRGWDFYKQRIARTSYGTATSAQMPGSLREMISPSINSTFTDVVENQLASRMVPRRAHGLPKPAFARVAVHGIECEVLVAEEGGTVNRFKLEFHHMSDEDVAGNVCYVISELDYDAHMELVRHIRDAMQPQDSDGADDS